MNCKICSAKVEPEFKHEVLGKYEATFYKCRECGFLFAGEPIWLEEAYGKSITDADTGLLARNISYSKTVAVLLYHQFKRDGLYLDYAGGYGIFTRLMRGAGFRFLHVDPYTENLFAREFEWNGSDQIDGVFSFECFEHLPEPMEDIEKMLSISKNVIFSTELLPAPVPPLGWEYYAFDHGQHISFYAQQTLEYIASTFGLHYLSVGGLHLFTPEPLNRRGIKKLLRKTNRAPYFFSNKTMFESVVRKMKKKE